MGLTKVKMHEAGHLGQVHFVYLTVHMFCLNHNISKSAVPNVDDNEEYRGFSCFVSWGEGNTHNPSGEPVSNNSQSGSCVCPPFPFPRLYPREYHTCAQEDMYNTVHCIIVCKCEILEAT